MKKIVLIFTTIVIALFFTGCKNSRQLKYEKAKHDREAVGNYTGYEKGTIGYLERTDPKHIAIRKKREQKKRKARFNANIKYLIFHNGKPYGIPDEALHFTSHKEAREIVRQGVCKKAAVFWVNKYFTSIHRGAKVGRDDPDYVKKYAKELKSWKRETQAGCAYPASNQEYQYMLNRQNQQNQNRRMNAQIRAQQQQARTESYQRTMDRLQAQNAQRNYNTQQTLDRMITPNKSTDSIINPSNNKFYIHSDGTSTRKVGNTYYHSNGTTTTAY